jgi:hypothetical protein
VGVPGVGSSGRVRIDRQDWIPWVRSEEAPEDDFDYRSASSGGKKVLFAVCYALALHIVAERNELPLPTLLMIDTPGKNVEKDINIELVRNIQRAIFDAADDGSLVQTQLIVVSGTFEPFNFDLEPIRITLRKDRGLIPYYRES